MLYVAANPGVLWALDAANGSVLWQAPLTRRTNGTPMTYRTKSGRQLVVVATGQGEDAALVAFAVGAAKTSTSGQAR